ncbi:MAG: hypothetical protein M1816_002058 [Peltula sp. TS41687]|nr:MAG: hypothetical protein M1816_002058 [Peltula sp. TS41687]
MPQYHVLDPNGTVILILTKHSNDQELSLGQDSDGDVNLGQGGHDEEPYVCVSDGVDRAPEYRLLLAAISARRSSRVWRRDLQAASAAHVRPTPKLSLMEIQPPNTSENARTIQPMILSQNTKILSQNPKKLSQNPEKFACVFHLIT